MSDLKSPHRVTMKEIAEELQLSRVTVSSVLNNRARGISEATARRVRDYIAQRGYVPSRSALQLRSSDRQQIGLIHCGHHYSHLNQAFNAIADALADSPSRLDLIIVRREKLLAGVQELLARGAGTIVWLQRSEHEVEFADEAMLNYLSNARCIIYNYQYEKPEWTGSLLDRGFCLVGVERQQAFANIARRVRELGHEQVAIPEVARKWAHRRARIFEGLGLEVTYSAPLIPEHAPRHNYAVPIAQNLLKARLEHGVTCACFSDDVTAGLVMHALLTAGIRIPDDLSVTGFNGEPLAPALAVPLTTVVMPVAPMVGRVLELIDGSSTQQHNLFDLRLIERDSLGEASPNPRGLTRRAENALEHLAEQASVITPSNITGLESVPAI